MFVANGRYTGGGMKIAPEARLNDGLFDVVTVGRLQASGNSCKIATGFMRARIWLSIK